MVTDTRKFVSALARGPGDFYGPVYDSRAGRKSVICRSAQPYPPVPFFIVSAAIIRKTSPDDSISSGNLLQAIKPMNKLCEQSIIVAG